MPGAERITERELVLPALFFIDLRNGITTSDLIRELSNFMLPGGEDIAILTNRHDTKFSQKVRNLVSHGTIKRLGYATYQRVHQNGLFLITAKGKNYLMNNMEIIEYLLSNNFTNKDIRTSFNNISLAIEKQKKVIAYDENLMITEGMRRNKNIALYERSRKLRNIAIEHYTNQGRIICSTCAFDFYDFYGEIGKGYIEIHHLKPVFQYEGEDKNMFLRRALDNVTPACSNCHRMIHRDRQHPLSMADLKAHIVNRNL